MRTGRRVLIQTAAFALAAAMAAAALLLPPGGGALAVAAFFHNPLAAGAVWDGAQKQKEKTQAARADWAQKQGAQNTPAPTQAPTASPGPSPSATPAPSPSATPAPTAPPDIQNPQPIVAQQYRQGSGDGYVALEAGSVKNSTDYPDAELGAAIHGADGALPFEIELNSEEPQVLILHTHATETYQTWEEPWYDPNFTARVQDKALNMCAVGARMAEILNAAGINTLHDETLHDSPSYTESYARSAQTGRDYLEKYPSIKVILDVHRDAIENSDGARVKPLCQIEGEDTAQVMIIAGCSNGDTIRLPNWRLNLQFAAAWESRMEALYPGLTRPVLCGYRFYNQDLTTGSLLIEIGGHANTVTEAIRGGEYAAKALAALFSGQKDAG